MVVLKAKFKPPIGELSPKGDDGLLEPSSAGDSLSVPTQSGWLPLTDAQKDGRVYLVTDDVNAEGVAVSWRLTRSFNRLRSQWQVKSDWQRFFPKGLVPFEPRFYKETTRAGAR